jgi:hypothetical protein
MAMRMNPRSGQYTVHNAFVTLWADAFDPLTAAVDRSGRPAMVNAIGIETE